MGSLVRGFIVLWVHEMMGSWLHGFHGFMGLFVHRFVSSWVRGFVGSWVHEFMRSWAHVFIRTRVCVDCVRFIRMLVCVNCLCVHVHVHYVKIAYFFMPSVPLRMSQPESACALQHHRHNV